jgi:hypothetical protein
MARHMGGVSRAGERIAGIVKNIQAIQDIKSYETKPYLQDLSIIKLD